MRMCFSKRINGLAAGSDPLPCIQANLDSHQQFALPTTNYQQEMNNGYARSRLTCSTGRCKYANPQKEEGLMPVYNSKEYRAWIDMRRRCYDKRRPQYRLYGARGIAVCERWLHDFQAFLSDVGYAPSSAHSLDRIDTSKNYTPDNVRWATAREQANNVRHNRIATVGNETKTAAEWAKCTGLNPATLRYRLRSGMSDEEAVTKPSKGRNRKIVIDGVARTTKEWSAILRIPVSTINYRHRKGLPITTEMNNDASF